MIKIEKVDVMNLENAIRGARNPLNSWHLADSYYDENNNFFLGQKDLDLALRLVRAGSDHRKFIRQIFVSLDITAPLYWWKEYDTYKVATVANSTSTMHKISAKEFELTDFSYEEMNEETLDEFKKIIIHLEKLRVSYNENKNKETWYSMIQFLPSSYNQKRTCTLNYENLLSMYFSRKSHKLKEWRVFCVWIKTLPYMEEFINVIEEKGKMC